MSGGRRGDGKGTGGGGDGQGKGGGHTDAWMALGNCYWPGVVEASRRDGRGMCKRSQSASNFVPRKLHSILRLRVPVGWGQGRACCFQNILEGQSEGWMEVETLEAGRPPEWLAPETLAQRWAWGVKSQHRGIGMGAPTPGDCRPTPGPP